MHHEEILSVLRQAREALTVRRVETTRVSLKSRYVHNRNNDEYSFFVSNQKTMKRHLENLYNRLM